MKSFSISSLYLDRAYLSVCCYILKLEGKGGEGTEPHALSLYNGLFFSFVLFFLFFLFGKKKVGNELGEGAVVIAWKRSFFIISYTLSFGIALFFFSCNSWL